VAHGTLRPVRRHGVNFAEVSEVRFQSGETFGLDPVIIGKQDDHAVIVAKKQ